MKANIEIHIKELVLNGIAPDDRYDIRLSIEHELTRLITEKGVPPQFVRNSEVANLDGGSFDLVSGSASDITGKQIAQAIYGGLSR